MKGLKIFIALILFFLLFGEYKVIVKVDSNKRVAKFNGVVWVGLDHYTIYKFGSKDKPKKVFEYTKTVNED